MRRSVARVGAAVVGSAALALGSLSPASAQVQQDGLVNVNVGDVTILEDVNIGVAAIVVAQVCGLKVGPVAVLGRAVDRSGADRVVCEAEGNEITLTQN
jgi:hypothetical protein